jgi:ATP-dependent RNA helicase DeaD
MTEFEGVVPALGRALANRGYSALTPVQSAVLNPELNDADMLVSAQTGSGKTVAFGLALAPGLLAGAERFEKPGAPLVLIVAPTRELALQVMRELQWLYEPTGAVLASCVGGMDMRAERRALNRGAHIVAGTPGRLCDHIRRGSLDTSQLRAVVLDEADEMLDLGFREDLEFILESTPVERRTLMFSATVPRSIANLAKQYQRDAVRISTSEEQKQHLDIEYRAITVASNERENAIINVLRYYEAKNALVFCATRATVSHMTARFNNRGFAVVALSGELSQAERTNALQAMRDGRARVCIATDVAARGIDLPNLDLVIHADLPTNREGLLHRSGRTGRAGRKGVSALIVPHNARKKAERLLKSANVTATWAKPPSAEDVTRRDDERILADPVLSGQILDTDRALVERLVASHGVEALAGAFVRLYRAGQSAPEELMDIAAPPPRSERSERQKKRRDDFGDSVWVSISVGRQQNAEPRWLLPMVCTAGQLGKSDVGAIKIQDNETFVQLAAGSAEGFFAAIGPNMTLEKNITAKLLDGPPKDVKNDRGRPFEENAPYAGKKRSGPAKKSGAGRPKGKPGGGPTPNLGRFADTAPENPGGDEHSASSPKHKKPGKRDFGKAKSRRKG